MEKQEFTLSLTKTEIIQVLSKPDFIYDSEGVYSPILASFFKKFLFIKDTMEGKSLQEVIINLTIS